MTRKLTLGALRQDSLRTYLSISAVAFEVTAILVLVGILKGMASHPNLIRSFIGGLTAILLVFVFLVSLIYIVVGRYAALYERSSELAILKALGASRLYVFNLLFLETLAVAIPGTIAGVAMALGSKLVFAVTLSDFLFQEIAFEWWPISGAIAAVTALSGALVAARIILAQDTGRILSED